MKFLSRILHAFTDHWWLKLLSLALAIVIYYSIKLDWTDSHPNHDTNFFQSH